ncbi:hypothetical protein [Alkalihalobacillus deserti]|uniref:hypothetical protein n=1 Tax=Alkalihalobacillus deserti TaxID=2879466 RepID=UPI001D15D9D5|nr:hypothetical protein [Alkalihalobacillus deserti]
MNLEECLRKKGKENPEMIRRIAMNLNVHPPIQNCAINSLISYIKKSLMQQGNLDRIIQSFTEVTQNHLRKKVFTHKSLPEIYEEEIKEFGLIYDGEIPSDIKVELKKKWLPYYIKTAPYQFEPTTPSAFLKLILILTLLQKEKSLKLNKRRYFNNHLNKIKKMVLINEEDNVVNHIIEYLKKNNLINWEDEKSLYPMTENIKAWFEQNRVENIREFYEWLKHKYISPNIMKLVDEISKYQNDENTWINTELFENRLLSDAQQSQLFGLLRIKKDEEQNYIQLTPEGWYISKKEHPLCWKSKDILLSAAFELFVPYYYDPYLIEEVYSFGDLISNELFIVFDVDPLDRKNKEQFYKRIEKFCRYVPDVVRYEYEN